MIPLKVLLLMRIVFAFLGFLLFQVKLRIALSNSMNWVGIFYGDCIDSVDFFWQDGHFYYINAANPRSWEIFPFSEVFDFFLQRLEVLVIQIFSLVWLASLQDILYCLWLFWMESLLQFLSQPVYPLSIGGILICLS